MKSIKSSKFTFWTNSVSPLMAASVISFFIDSFVFIGLFHWVVHQNWILVIKKYPFETHNKRKFQGAVVYVVFRMMSLEEEKIDVGLSLHEKCPNAEFVLARFLLYSDWTGRFTQNNNNFETKRNVLRELETTVM